MRNPFVFVRAACVTAAIVSSFMHALPAVAADDRTEGRRLFAEALQDEERKDFAVALEKFRRVLSVRETGAIRYRIAACFEGMGHFREAIVEYDRAAVLAKESSPQEPALAESASAKSSELKKKLARLTLVADRNDLEVKIDDQPVASSGVIELDPGSHTLVASAPGATSFRTQVSLPPSGEMSLPIHLTAGDGKKDAPPSTGDTQGSNWLPYAAIGAGVALVAASTVTLVIRHSDINKIKDTCPGNVCARSSESEITSLRNGASTEGIVGGVLGAAGVVALGAGIYLLVDSGPAKPTATRLVPIAGRDALGMSFEGRF